MGGAIAPLIGARFLFSGVEHDRAALDAMAPAARAAYRAGEAQLVQMPYLMLAGVVLLVALAIALVRLPEIPRDTGGTPWDGLRSVLGVRTLRRAVVAQFFYVGAQVGVWSFFIDVVKTIRPAMPERQAAYLLSISLALFLAGRLIGTILMHRIVAARMLAGFAIANIVLLLVAALGHGATAIGALLLSGFFMSIMFPTIFSLGVRDLGPRAPLGAPLMVMAVIGGAVFPPLMGWLSRGTVTIQSAMLLPCLSFAVVLGFALTVQPVVQR